MLEMPSQEIRGLLRREFRVDRDQRNRASLVHFSHNGLQQADRCRSPKLWLERRTRGAMIIASI
jgi:hypothetical protein